MNSYRESWQIGNMAQLRHALDQIERKLKKDHHGMLLSDLVTPTNFGLEVIWTADPDEIKINFVKGTN